MIRRHLIQDVQLHREPILRRESLERAREHHALLGCHGRVWWRIGCTGGRLRELGNDVSARPLADRAVGAAQFAKKVTERQVGGITGAEQLVGFDMRPAVDKDVFEYALLEWRHRGRHSRKARTAIAETEPSDRDVVNNGKKERRERAVRLPAGGAAP